MADSINPFFAAAERAAEKITDRRHEVEKAKVPDWDKEFLPMAQVRKRLEQATSPDERRAIREEIRSMPDGEKKMGQLLSGYRRKP